MISTLYYTAIRRLGIPGGVRRVRDAAVVLCYHNVVADELPGGLGEPSLHMPLARFRDQMRWLARHYTVLPLRELEARRARGQPLRRLACLTFDDAYNGVFEHALPVLAEQGLRATVFVVTAAPDNGETFWWDHPATRHVAARPEERRRWLVELRGDRAAILEQLGARPEADGLPHSLRPADWTTIQAAAAGGWEIGVHSASHRTLTRLTTDELTEELVGSRDTLAHHTGITAECFSYPYGLWDERVRGAVQAAGYTAAVSLDTGLVTSRADAWALPRMNIPRTIGREAFEAWTAGLGPSRRERE